MWDREVMYEVPAESPPLLLQTSKLPPTPGLEAMNHVSDLRLSHLEGSITNLAAPLLRAGGLRFSSGYVKFVPRSLQS